MDNTNETQGVRVLSTVPALNETNVNVNSSIDVEFSSEINVGTIIKNIIVLEDINKIYTDINSLKDYSKFAVTKGSIVYDNMILTYTPNEPFHTDSNYIVILNDAISDITGNLLNQKYIFNFYTEKVATYPPCEFTSPKYGTIASSIPTFSWKNQNSLSYLFQISKVNTFETLIVEEVIAGNEISDTISYTPEFEIQEGIYHIRVKSENGEWSNVHQIFIKPITDDVIAYEDTPILQNFDEFLDNLIEPIEVLEVFPPDGASNVSLKTNIFYIKMKGKVDQDRINIGDSYVFGETLNEDSFSESHGIVSGEWIIIYDEYEDATYVIFQLGTFSKPIDPEADKLLIQNGFSLSVIVNTPLQDVITLIQEKVNSLKGITSPHWILNQSELLVYTPELEISEEPITETLTFTNGEVVTEDTIVSITIIEKPQEEPDNPEEPQDPEDPDNPNQDNSEDNNDENNQGNVQEQENQEDNPNQESNIPTTEGENNNQEPVNDSQNTENNSTDTENSGNTNNQESNAQEENTSSNTGQEESTENNEEEIIDNNQN